MINHALESEQKRGQVNMCNALEELKLEGKQEGIEEGTVYFLVVPFDDRFLFPCDYFRWSNLPGGGLFAVSLVRFQCP